MGAELIYLSKGAVAGAAIAEALTHHESVRVAREDWLARFNATHPSSGEPRRFATLREGGIACVEAAPGEPVPTGFKFINDQHVPGWQPKLSTKAGKAIKAQWDEMKSHPLPEAAEALGMPTSLFGGDSLHRCGLALKDEAHLIVTWGSRELAPQVERQLNRRDTQGHWREWKRSEYYAWLESKTSEEGSA